MARKDIVRRREYDKEHWAALKAAGICTWCHKVPASENSLRCDACIRRFRDVSKLFSSKRRHERIAKGLCERCGKRPPRLNKTNCEECVEKRKVIYHAYREKRIIMQKLDAKRAKFDCFKAYGGCKCSCCGESRPEFMTMDHINGDGRAFKGTTHRSGNGLYRWLKRQDYPVGFRVLCMNCNWSYGKFGYCPHQGKP